MSLQPLNWNQYLLPHIKDLFHICLEIKAQGFWMTFKVCNHGPKYPYLLHKMGFVDSQFCTIVLFSKISGIEFTYSALSEGNLAVPTVLEECHHNRPLMIMRWCHLDGLSVNFTQTFLLKNKGFLSKQLSLNALARWLLLRMMAWEWRRMGLLNEWLWPLEGPT